FAHHRHTHENGIDPELMTPKPETVWQYAKYISGGPMWLSLTKTLWLNALGPAQEDFVPPRGKRQVVIEARITLAIYLLCIAASITFASDFLLWLWLVPALIGQPFLRAYLLAEHARCPH